MKNKTIKSGLSILALAVVMLMTSFSAEGQEPLNSKYGGVQIGAITYSFRTIREVEDVLQACVDAGLSSVELMGTGVEAYLGAPVNPVSRREMRRPDELSDEKKEALKKYQEEIKTWRYSEETMDKYSALKKKFNDAGVNIHIYNPEAFPANTQSSYTPSYPHYTPYPYT